MVDIVSPPKGDLARDQDFVGGKAAANFATGVVQMAGGVVMTGTGSALTVTSAGTLAPASVPLAVAGVAVAANGAGNVRNALAVFQMAGKPPPATQQTAGTSTSPSPDAAGGAPKIRNADLAGEVHPKTGVPFDKSGYPDFSAYRHPDVPDVRNRAIGFSIR